MLRDHAGEKQCVVEPVSDVRFFYPTIGFRLVGGIMGVAD